MSGDLPIQPVTSDDWAKVKQNALDCIRSRPGTEAASWARFVLQLLEEKGA